MSKSIFDPQQWQHTMRRYHRNRDFLRNIMLEEVKEKLNDHQRIFKKYAVIGFDPKSWINALNIPADPIKFNENLNFPSNQYDAILHLGALHRTDDVIGQIVQSRLALAPDGVFIAAFLGGESLAELRNAMIHAEVGIYNGASPHIAPMIDLRDAGRLMSRAGLALPVTDQIRQRATYPNTRALMHDLRDLALTNPLAARRRHFTRRSLFDACETHYRKDYACEDNKIYANYELIFLTGYAPSSTQPKPLKPGSAQISLGDALEKLKDK